jgi:hypothetical protein
VCGCLQLHLVMTDLKWRDLPRIQLQRCLPNTGESLGVTVRGSYCVGSRGGSTVSRQVVKSCLSVTIGREDQLGSLPSLILFSLAVPPFQPKMVGSYLIRGIWFHSHLPVEEISYIQILRPMVHEVQDPDRYIFR